MLNKFLDAMPKELFDELPFRRQIDHVIEVMPRMAPFTNAPYRMNHEVLKELKVQLEKLFAKGYIKPSKSPYGTPTSFVHEKDGALTDALLSHGVKPT
jgi:hypothetical protein